MFPLLSTPTLKAGYRLSKLTQFPNELLECIFYHLVVDRDVHDIWTDHPVPNFSGRRSILSLRFVCSQWAFIGQRVLWKHLRIFDCPKRILCNPAFGQHPITSLMLFSIPMEDANNILGGLKGLKYLFWGISSDKEATWWNNENLVNLVQLEFALPIVLPRHPQHHFQLKELIISNSYARKDINGEAFLRVVECCSSTIEIMDFEFGYFSDEYHPLAWFDRSKLPCLRILRATIPLEEGKPIMEHFEGFTHLRLREPEYLDLTIPNSYVFPSTLESLEIVYYTNLEKHFSHGIALLRSLDGKKLPSLRTIRIHVPRRKRKHSNLFVYDPCYSPQDYDEPRSCVCLDPVTRQLCEELFQEGRIRAFWKMNNVSFDVHKYTPRDQ